MPAQEDDKALAAAFAAHEAWAFGEAYRRYAALLYSTAYTVLGNPEDAQDCVADAVARLWRSPGAYASSRGNLRSFLAVCVRNEAISRRRRAARSARLVERIGALPEEHDEIQLPDPIERDRVRSALSALPQDQRTPLELAYYGEKTHREIAAELREPLGTIKSRIKLGLRKIGSALKANASVGGDYT
ncbi:MAG TPA: sigma-70 family RNA polymerase sigma factor [Candidatus Tumulicola sp.]|jgi:RNA polymerase sigma-70 factor (ECF subfamily)